MRSEKSPRLHAVAARATRLRRRVTHQARKIDEARPNTTRKPNTVGDSKLESTSRCRHGSGRRSSTNRRPSSVADRVAHRRERRGGSGTDFPRRRGAIAPRRSPTPLLRQFRRQSASRRPAPVAGRARELAAIRREDRRGERRVGELHQHVRLVGRQAAARLLQAQHPAVEPRVQRGRIASVRRRADAAIAPRGRPRRARRRDRGCRRRRRA